jgi:hypothetical protein
MTDTRSRHVPDATPGLYPEYGTEHSCEECGQRWPCDAIREADEKDRIREQGNALILAAEARADKAEAALAEKQTESFRMSDVLTAAQEQCERHQQDVLAQRDAARADAERLALHLRNAIADLVGDWELLGGPQMRYADAEAALAAHEEATR